MSTADPQLESASTTRRLARLLASFGPLLGLLVVVIIFGLIEYKVATGENRRPVFFTAESAQTVLKHSSLVGVAALGMTLIIIAGGIDLSAGTAIALSATITALCFREGFGLGAAAHGETISEWPIWAQVLLAMFSVTGGVLCGCLCGLVNGGLIGLLRLVPFIVTLSTMMAFQGIGRTIAGNTPIRAIKKVPDAVLSLQDPVPDPEWLMVCPGVWLMLLLAAAVAVLLHHTVLGRHIFAIGSNESTARLCGINVFRTRLWVYSIAGLFIGIAGVYQFAVHVGEGDPTKGMGLELKVIAAVVIGGGSLSGGRGSVLGTLSGACIMGVILYGSVLIGVDDHYQDILIGLIIIAAVTFDQFRLRLQSA